MTIDYFYNDSTSMGDIDLDGVGGSGHALFVNPADRLLYAVLDSNWNGDRNLYQINPFTETFNQVHDFASGYINTACIASDGNVYAVTGNGGGTNGQITKLDMGTMTESTYFNSTVSSSRGIEYNPMDSTFYIFEGFSDLVFKVTFGTPVETVDTTTGMNDELHGAYYDEAANIFFLCAYGGEMYTTDNTYLNGTLYHDLDNGVTGNNDMDITRFDFLDTDTAIAHCPGDTSMLGVLYAVDSISWFHNGVMIPGEHGLTIPVSAAGNYQALVGVNMNQGFNFIWSEIIPVVHYTIPVVEISAQGNDSILCPGDTIRLTGAASGSLQWYLNGSAITGATNPNYEATAVGLYNQVKINMSGCEGKAAKDFELYDGGLDCFTSVAQPVVNGTEFYPNPIVDKLTIESNSKIQAVEVYNLTGALVYRQDVNNSNKVVVDFTTFNSGAYFITVKNTDGVVTRKMMK